MKTNKELKKEIKEHIEVLGTDIGHIYFNDDERKEKIYKLLNKVK